MFCNQCGKKLKDGESICENCGAQIDNKKENTIKTVENDYKGGGVFSWIIGCFFILFVFGGWSTIVYAIAGVLFLPPIAKLIYDKFNFKITVGKKWLIFLIAIIISGVISSVATVPTQNEIENDVKNDEEKINEEISNNEADTSLSEETDNVISNQEKQNEQQVENQKAESKQEEKKQEKISVPREYKNALNKAKLYSQSMHMSKQGIYDQLISPYGENFPEDAAEYAVNNLVADYNKNALAKAKIYYNEMSMSKQSVYDQLTSSYGEQFTASEAQYAIDNLE